MLKKLFLKSEHEATVEEKVEEPVFPYQRILHLLEELSEEEVEKVESYLPRLKQRHFLSSKKNNPNKRTKGRYLKLQQKQKQVERTLDEEIKEAKTQLLVSQFGETERRKK